MLMFLAKGENAINGLRNHDLRKWLYWESEQAGKDQQKKYSGRTTRRIKLLRAHGLIRKIPRANPLCFDGERPEVLLFADDRFNP